MITTRTYFPHGLNDIEAYANDSESMCIKCTDDQEEAILDLTFTQLHKILKNIIYIIKVNEEDIESVHLKGNTINFVTSKSEDTAKEIEQLKAASALDKAILIASLLRAAGSEDAAVVFGNKYVSVKFSHMGENYALDVENNTLLKGAEAEGFVEGSEPKYIFNDLFFEFGKQD